MRKYISLKSFSLVLALLAICACGGGVEGGSSPAVHKTMIVHYNNNALIDVTFVHGAVTTPVQSGKSAEFNSFLQLQKPGDTATWAFSAKNGAGAEVGHGSFTWTYANSKDNGKLDVNLDPVGGFSFNPEP